MIVRRRPGARACTAQVRYDDQGRAVESRSIGVDRHVTRGTSLAVYYTAGPHAEKAECGNKPAYAGCPA